jgi:hypothetical protein
LGSFIHGIVVTTKDFYADVLQHLSAWKARPAKLPRPADEQEALLKEVAAENAALVAPIEQAQAEQSGNDADDIQTDPGS